MVVSKTALGLGGRRAFQTRVGESDDVTERLPVSASSRPLPAFVSFPAYLLALARG